jgi:hypothetical protein
MYKCTAYIADMSYGNSKRARYRQRQAAAALRARRSRADRRIGLVTFHVKTNRRRLIGALVAAGRLNDLDVSQQEIERAVGQVLEDLANRWLGPAR